VVGTPARLDRAREASVEHALKLAAKRLEVGDRENHATVLPRYACELADAIFGIVEVVEGSLAERTVECARAERQHLSPAARPSDPC
jgi:hypothetical protein